MSKETMEDYITSAREGKYLDLIQRLYADDAVSVEAVEMPGAPRAVEGKGAIIGKSQWFESNFRVDRQELRGPWPHGEDMFAVHMSFDMTHLESGEQSSLDEIIVLTMREGKIVKEEFFYAK